ncbi:hypothetical protein AAJCM20276_32940 [Acetobacter aceti]|uniref:Transposase n=1 Tax=Acetobacter aceti TaxID=435 RepID=A0A6S6PNN1_ACEAC|nr:hypothetical protein AAJCM20276_32940 [Acetobacter aceti]
MERVPDAKTIWLFRERLTQAGAIERDSSSAFNATLRNTGYLSISGQILLGAPKQRNTNAEKSHLQAGRIPEGWKDKPTKLSHKDKHALWTLKFTKAKRQDEGTIPSTDLAIPFFGYKSHIPLNRRFRKWKATDPVTSDGARLREGLLDCRNTASDVWADTACRSKAKGAFMEKQDFVSKIHRKKPTLQPMPRYIKRSNTGKSVIRSQVEHVFADQKSQTGLFI